MRSVCAHPLSGTYVIYVPASELFRHVLVRKIGALNQKEWPYFPSTIKHSWLRHCFKCTS